MPDLRRVTYCGLYCALCASGGRVPRQARSLRDTLQKTAIEHWGATITGFTEFWRFLGELTENDERCSCRERTCGPPFCTIRKCAPERGVDACPFCPDYPCERIRGLAKGYVTLIADGERMKRIGLDAWIREQEERARTGFCYADIRCHPYEVPDK
jgi:hypothetical protein